MEDIYNLVIWPVNVKTDVLIVNKEIAIALSNQSPKVTKAGLSWWINSLSIVVLKYFHSSKSINKSCEGYQENVGLKINIYQFFFRGIQYFMF